MQDRMACRSVLEPNRWQSVAAMSAEGVASEQPRRVLAVRALLAPWNSASLVSYRSSRDSLS